MVHHAFIGLGSNLQQPVTQLKLAFEAIERMRNTRLLARSSLYRTAPLGCPADSGIENPDFVNAVVKIETALSPRELLDALLDIEHHHGRERTFRNAPRTLDLDVLLYDDLRVHEHGLTIPHPQMHLRAFVLLPLLEIAPGVEIPGLGGAELALSGCQDQILEKMADAV